MPSGALRHQRFTENYGGAISLVSELARRGDTARRAARCRYAALSHDEVGVVCSVAEWSGAEVTAASWPRRARRCHQR
eukprot:6188687-Pleurochrysis_carterae.AAC.2